MVFRRENKVDAFQRQMNQLRTQMGADQAPGMESDYPNDGVDMGYDDTPMQGDYPRGDAGGYSFGTYPAEGEPAQENGGQHRPAMPAIDEQITVVAKGTISKGELQSDGSIQIFGRAEGTLTAKDDVWLAEGSEVDATINARRVVVAGRVNGQIHASGRFEALPEGVIEADVVAPTFVVHEGAAINGKLTMTNADHSVTSGRAERAGSSGTLSRRARQ